MSSNRKELLEEEFKNWEDDTSDIGYQIYEYMSMQETGTWCDSISHGKNLWKLMFDEEIEPDSPIEVVFTGIAYHAAKSVEESVARMFGLEESSVGLVLAEYIEEPTNKEVLTFEKFLEKYNEYKEKYST